MNEQDLSSYDSAPGNTAGNMMPEIMHKMVVMVKPVCNNMERSSATLKFLICDKYFLRLLVVVNKFV